MLVFNLRVRCVLLIIIHFIEENCITILLRLTLLAVR